MILEVNNEGAVDLANNWNAGGCIRHVDVRHKFLHKLKEDGVLIVKSIPGPMNDADLHKKNFVVSDFEKHVAVYPGKDAYLGMKLGECLNQ